MTLACSPGQRSLLGQLPAPRLPRSQILSFSRCFPQGVSGTRAQALLPPDPTPLDPSPHRALGPVAESGRVLLLPFHLYLWASASPLTMGTVSPALPLLVFGGRVGYQGWTEGRMQEGEPGGQVGLGHPPVASTFQSSTWMRASSFTRSWASSGELGARGFTAPFFLFSLPRLPGQAGSGGIHCSSQPCWALFWVPSVYYGL